MACECACLIPSSHRRHGQYCPVVSCLVRVGGVNRIVDKSGLSARENFKTVLSSLKMWCEQSFVLSWASF